MYYNTDTDSCEPWVAPNVYVSHVYVPIPNFSGTSPSPTGVATSPGAPASGEVLIAHALLNADQIIECRSDFTSDQRRLGLP